MIFGRDTEREREEKEVKRLGGGGSEPPDIDPIILCLLERLPKPGDVWPEAERKLWLELLNGSFKLIYKDKKDDGRGDIDALTK
jgi:hypothetical protein